MSYFPSSADQAFLEAGPLYHLYTKPLETDTFYADDAERKTVMNYLAISVKEQNCVLLAFALMSNHFHFILEGESSTLLKFFDRLKSLMKNFYRHHGRTIDLSGMVPGFTRIDNIRQFQNELAYVIRNPFVVQQDVNVLADPWSSGYLYFNPLLEKTGIPGNELTVRELRQITQSRQFRDLDAQLYFRNGLAQAWSFTDYQKVMSFYDNARQFVHSVLKNVESQVELSVQYGEMPQLTDTELYPLVYRLCREVLKTDKPASLDERGRKKLAVLLKNKYYASNGQIARVAKIPLSEVNAIFPLAVKNQIK